MPNKNYEKGRRKEYKVCENLKKEGFPIVQRTAGSHSPFDIIAVDLKNRIIKLVQVKSGKYSRKAKKDFERVFYWYNEGQFKVKFEAR